MHNLSVSRGTLTDDELLIIQEHVVQSILMLDKISFPHHIEKVLEYASGHHEQTDGKGYPKGLTGEQIEEKDITHWVVG